MEETLTLAQIQDVDSLIQVRQLPIIEEHLRAIAPQINAAVNDALALACTPETLTAVKARRAELNKMLSGLEDVRKTVKAQIMAPYDTFNDRYNGFVSDLKTGIAKLGEKLADTEQVIIDACEAEMIDYFRELTASESVEWLTYDRMGLKIGLTEARQKTYKRLREKIGAFVAGVRQDVESISTMEGAAEIMAEYKQSLSLSSAVATVFERNRRVQEEQEAEERRKAAAAAEKARVARVVAAARDSAPAPVAPPVAAPAVVVENAAAAPEKVYKLSFAVHGTKAQLIQFKTAFVNYCEKEGLKYE